MYMSLIIGTPTQTTQLCLNEIGIYDNEFNHWSTILLYMGIF